MSFKEVKMYFNFTVQQRISVFLLLIAILILQLVYCFVDFSSPEKIYVEKEKWIALQSEVDNLKKKTNDQKLKIYPFNPNFISDYKGYKLGMSIQEIDRLLAFRKEDKYVNSAKEFQQVTKISDSLLEIISPSFKFPDWTHNNKKAKKDHKEFVKQPFYKKEKITILDINNATKEDLMKVYGVGEALSARILKQKETLTAFVSMEQMNDVWGLSPEVISELKACFKVLSVPKINKIKINDASLKELTEFSYFRYALSKQIVTYRSMNGNIQNIEELSKIKGFPVEKANIIALYLEF